METTPLQKLGKGTYGSVFVHPFVDRSVIKKN